MASTFYTNTLDFTLIKFMRQKINNFELDSKAV